MKLPTKKRFHITFYVFHVPILLLLAVVLVTTGALSSVITSTLVNKDENAGFVLGEGSSGSGSGKDLEDTEGNSGSGSRSKSDKDEDESDNSGSGNSDSNDKSNSSGSSNSGSGSSSSGTGPGGFVGIKNVADFDEEVEEESKKRLFVVNEDGTTTEVRKEEKEGELKVEVRTYDINGNKIMVERYENEDGLERSRIKVYDESGNKLSDLRLRTEDGKELELRVKEDEVELSRVRFDAEKQELIVRVEDDVDADFLSNASKLRIRVDGDNFRITRSGIEVLSRFPLVIDDETGEIFVQTPVGNVQLKTMPETIVEKAQTSDDLENIAAIELSSESTSSNSAPLEFKLFGTKSEKLLGVFNLQIPSTLVYDAASGGFLRSEQPFITRILDLFSF